MPFRFVPLCRHLLPIVRFYRLFREGWTDIIGARQIRRNYEHNIHEVHRGWAGNNHFPGKFGAFLSSQLNWMICLHFPFSTFPAAVYELGERKWRIQEPVRGGTGRRRPFLHLSDQRICSWHERPRRIRSLLLLHTRKPNESAGDWGRAVVALHSHVKV